VIQSIKPYVSSEDIHKGGQWFAEVAQELDATTFGIICVTKANADEPWLNFEAGAIFKSVDAIDRIKRQVTPFLIDLEATTDLNGPLANLQATKADHDDVAKLVRSLNALNDEGEQLDDALLNDAIEVWWPRLKEQLDAARKLAESQPRPTPRTTDSKVEEILELTRAMQRRIIQPTGVVNVRTSEQEGYRTKKIYDDIWETLNGADIRHRILSVQGNSVEVEVYYLADLPEHVKPALDDVARRRGLTINVTTIEHPDPEYIARR